MLRNGSVVARRGDSSYSYRLASLSKMITAWATLIACEEGVVSLDDEVGPATLRHLLAHAAGFGFDGDTPIMGPGKRRIYSNTGIETVAAHVAGCADMPFDRYLHEAVFEPLGMTSSALRGSAAFAVWSTLDDTYVVDSIGDTLVEAAGGGVDLVQVGINITGGAWTLPDQVENGQLLGSLAFSLTGNGLANVLTGNGAANTLSGGAGADTLVGAAGDDVYVIDSLSDSVVESAGAGNDTVRVAIATAGGAYTLAANVENAILVNAVAYDLSGNALANNLTGNAAANRLEGGDGADTLAGGGGADTLAGGAGDDVYVLDDALDLVVEAAGAGVDTVQFLLSTTGATFTLGAEIENGTLLSTGLVNLAGNALANVLTGGGGANLLTGGAGADTLSGGTGDDTLSGGSGADRLTGGSGYDAFRFDILPDAGADVITDFAVGVDKILLSKAVFAGLAGAALGPLAAGLFWSGAGVTAAHDADDRLVYDTTTGTLYYDADGLGGAAAIALATFGGAKPLLSAGDFILAA